MAGRLLVRLGRAVLAAWGITSVIFLLIHLLLVPASQPEVLDTSDLTHSPPISTAAAQQAVRHRLGLDLPVFYVTRSAGPPVQWHWHGRHNRYHLWLSQLLRGDLGYSYRSNQPVSSLVGPALAYTLPLMAAAAALAVACAIGLALVLANAPATSNGWAFVRSSLVAMQAVPLFALALGLLLLFANPDFLDILRNVRSATAAYSGLGAYLIQMILPLVSLVLAVLPALALPLEASLCHELSVEYCRAARAKGLTSWQVATRHALPNALLPMLTTFTGLLPSLVAGAVVVEVLFALPGTGRLLADAAAAHDYPVVVAGVLLTALAQSLALLLADILYYWADPRLRPST